RRARRAACIGRGDDYLIPEPNPTAAIDFHERGEPLGFLAFHFDLVDAGSGAADLPARRLDQLTADITDAESGAVRGRDAEDRHQSAIGGAAGVAAWRHHARGSPDEAGVRFPDGFDDGTNALERSVAGGRVGGL